ncbi:DUF2628 domain-containing protein [Tepidibacter hydrothermalis]|uniref:Zinc ribbon domain-containing protein n=1 Tax=Tepidibacter hydrothermalis TaxID=3036126 RepID=A0ABY8E7A6_9FIRM|nr:zinc ribbon domain-containing protein [Tepidibacter hydrothermalis]WFD08783.1 zinc ribbon domain-containing protein [Tepidibacter hydrothermalis]
MYCRNCGSEIKNNAEICLKCGVKPLNAKNYCQECGSETNENQEICIKCGTTLKSILNSFNINSICKYCRNCGSEIKNNAEICLKCGVKPLNAKNYCQECGSETNENQEICIKCGVRLKTTINNESKLSGFKKHLEGDGNCNTNFSKLKPYYQEEFTKIYESNESYRGKFNWAGFFFGPIWALTKGIWIPPLAVLILALIGFGPIPASIYGIICGFKGNYIFYNYYVRKKQIFF